ncbi:MAG: ferrous iron transport protein A [Aminipila sp.]
MPLTMTTPGRAVTISAIRGKDDTKRFLENLGFIEGSEIMVISELGGNVIVNVKDARVAISKAMASRIFIS